MPKANTEIVWSVGKRTAAMLGKTAGQVADLFRQADASTMSAARMIRDTFAKVAGLTYDRWAVHFADGDREVLTPSRVSQFLTAARVEEAAGVALTSERQARDLAASLKADGIDVADRDAVRNAIAESGGVAERVATFRKGKVTSGRKASASAPAKPTAAMVADPVKSCDDAVQVLRDACRGNAETLRLLADNLRRHADAISASIASPAATGKARKVTA